MHEEDYRRLDLRAARLLKGNTADEPLAITMAKLPPEERVLQRALHGLRQAVRDQRQTCNDAFTALAEAERQMQSKSQELSALCDLMEGNCGTVMTPPVMASNASRCAAASIQRGAVTRGIPEDQCPGPRPTHPQGGRKYQP